MARSVINGLAQHLGMSTLETAEGVLTLLNNNMANAIRSRTVQKGIDPRDFSLVAFGGGGPMHGAEVAALLNIPEVIVPPYPGLNSAVGLLTTDMKYDAVKTAFQISGTVDLDRINNSLETMERFLAERFQADGIAAAVVSFVRSADLRFMGQGYELRIPLEKGRLDDIHLERIWQAFHTKHKAEYGRSSEDSPIEIVNLRVTGVGRKPKITQPAIDRRGSLADAKIKIGRCLFRLDDSLESLETVFFKRDLLPVGAKVNGPAIILQTDTTTLVPPGCTCLVSAEGNLIINIGEGDA